MGLQQVVELGEDLPGLTLHAEAGIFGDDAGEVEDAVVLDHLMHDAGIFCAALDHLSFPDAFRSCGR